MNPRPRGCRKSGTLNARGPRTVGRRGDDSRRKTSKPLETQPRPFSCMSSLSGALRLPATGEAIAVERRVDYKNEEAALVRRAQNADEMAFREIVERYQSKVFLIIYGILRNHNDAEDIAQQVFTKVYFSIKSFDFRSSLLTWIYKITVNECYDYLRKRKVRRLVYESDFSREDALR